MFSTIPFLDHSFAILVKFTKENFLVYRDKRLHFVMDLEQKDK